ncbi:MAG: hypothetical protein OQJ91_12740 [Motiliproteus sp.]|nr:hypothetical protein [Motiliproteus sp.]
MRRVHLYAGLFLAPWILIYATSAFLLNHDQWFRDVFKVVTPGWMVIEETALHPRDKPEGPLSQQAQSLLEHLGLPGPHRIQPTSTAERLVVLRFSGSGDYRLTWLRQQNNVVIERRGPFSIYNYLHYLHFRKGYGVQGGSTNVWAGMVDLITLSI